MQQNFMAQQVCVVTGGTQGIGWAITQALADHGARVYACGLNEKRLAEAAQALVNVPWGNNITLTRCDVSKRNEVDAWIRGIYQQTGRIDVLVNNAAYVCWKNVIDMSLEEAERTMAVAYNGMLYTSKAVLPQMLTTGHGHIINIGSATGRVYVGGASAAYSAAKAAIEAYTRILQVELRGTPVRTTLVRLGTVAGTDFFRIHVPQTRMPRFADLVPALTPPQVASGVLHVIQRPRDILDMPGFLPLFYLTYALAPRFLGWIVHLGGSAHTNYGSHEWHYKRN